MPKELPARPNIDHLKSQAKDLLDAYARGEPSALARFRDELPSARGKTDGELVQMKLALHDAHSVIAREYGFASFEELRKRVEDPTASLMAAHPNAPLPPQVLDALAHVSAHAEKVDAITSATSLPLVPLRGALLTVGAVAPINIARASSIAAAASVALGTGLVAMFSQKDAANEAPELTDIHPVGCIVQLLAKLDLPQFGTFLVVRGAQWARLESIERTAPFFVARVTPFVIAHGEDDRVAEVEAKLRDKVRVATRAMPGGDRIRAAIEKMDALALADATVANLPCSVDDKARYASEATVIARLERALALVGG